MGRRLASAVVGFPLLFAYACGNGYAGTPEENLPDRATPEAGSDAVVDATDAGDASPGPTLVDCLGAQRDAFLCDGFEGAAPSPNWEIVLEPPTSAKVATVAAQQVAGVKSLETTLLPLPDKGAAKLRWGRAPTNEKLAMQVSIYVDGDAWTVGQLVPLGGFLNGGTEVARLVYESTSLTGDGNVLLSNGSTKELLGTVKLNGWACYELVFDGAKIDAYVGDALVRTTAATKVNRVEVGMDWNNGAAAASKTFHFDDVIISPGRIGCVH